MHKNMIKYLESEYRAVSCIIVDLLREQRTPHNGKKIQYFIGRRDQIEFTLAILSTRRITTMYS